MRTDNELEQLGHLGSQKTQYSQNYDPSLLEAFDNKNPNAHQWVSFVCTEFTSLCPKTGQPDFARIFINYIADEKMVESKSLKLYLFSFRNHGDFHEDCIEKICQDLKQLIAPHYLEVIGEFTPRGGIAIFPFSSTFKGEYENVYLQRKIQYSPGQYTMTLGKPYA